MTIWDDIIPPEDLKMFSKAKMGGKSSYGKKPAIIVVDMTYGFVDDVIIQQSVIGEHDSSSGLRSFLPHRPC